MDSEKDMTAELVTKTQEEAGVALEQTNQRTPKEMMAAMLSAVTTAVQYRLLPMESGITIVELTRELLHWAFTKPGVHATPAELLAEMIMMSPNTTGKGNVKMDA
jgi:hypothetical protein